MTRHSIASKLAEFAKLPQTGVSLKQLYEFGMNPTPETTLKAAQFLHRELPVRLAHRVIDLDSMESLSRMPSVRNVHALYTNSFQEVMESNFPTNNEEELAFTAMLESIKARHANVVTTMAQGVRELKKETGFLEVDERLNGFLDRFYMSRIGIRVLIGQQMALHHNPQDKKNRFVGLLDAECKIASVCQDAIEDAREICMRTYGDAPEVMVRGKLDLAITYVPSHLHHMCFELVKNSLRAVLEFHGAQRKLPNVLVIISGGEEDVVVKISDEGGGISLAEMKKIFSYFFTTVQKEVSVEDQEGPMAGLGFGLPLSRLYARYFGGEMNVISMQGYGTDAYLHLSRLGDKDEPLP